MASKILFASPYNCAQLKKLLSVITYHMGGLYRYTFHFEHWHVDVKHSFFVFVFFLNVEICLYSFSLHWLFLVVYLIQIVWDLRL